MTRKKPKGWKGESQRHSDAAVLGWKRRIGLLGMPPGWKPGYKTGQEFRRKLEQQGFTDRAILDIKREIWLRPFTKDIVKRLQRGDHVTLKELERLLKEEGQWKKGPFKLGTGEPDFGFVVHKYIAAMPGVKYDSPVYEETETGVDMGGGEPYLVLSGDYWTRGPDQITVVSNQAKSQLPFVTR